MTAIYALKDPRDGRIRYVGRSRDPQSRLIGHLNGTVPAGKRCRAWLSELLAAGAVPELIVMEQAPDDGAADAETNVISTLREKEPLLNVRTGVVPGPWKRPRQKSQETISVTVTLTRGERDRIMRYVEKHGFGTMRTFFRHAAIRMMRSRR